MKLILSAAFAAAILVSGCAQNTPASGSVVNVYGGSYRLITSAQLTTMLGNKDFMLVNVHYPYVGEIEGTDKFIPYDKIEQSLSELPQNKGAKIVVYCQSGHMSATAARTLVRMGYTGVMDLEGGMMGWEQQGHQLMQFQK